MRYIPAAVGRIVQARHVPGGKEHASALVTGGPSSISNAIAFSSRCPFIFFFFTERGIYRVRSERRAGRIRLLGFRQILFSYELFVRFSGNVLTRRRTRIIFPPPRILWNARRHERSHVIFRRDNPVRSAVQTNGRARKCIENKITVSVGIADFRPETRHDARYVDL